MRELGIDLADRQPQLLIQELLSGPTSLRDQW